MLRYPMCQASHYNLNQAGLVVPVGPEEYGCLPFAAFYTSHDVKDPGFPGRSGFPGGEVHKPRPSLENHIE